MYYYALHTKKVLFSHMPKCCSESVRHLLLSETNEFVDNKDLWTTFNKYIISERKTSKCINDYTLITLCRNPYNRLVSGYLDKFCSSNFFLLPFCKKVMDFYKRDMKDERRVSFAELVYYILLQEPKSLDDHFKPQTLLFNINYKNNIFKMENVGEYNNFIKNKLNFKNQLINYNKVILNHNPKKINLESKVMKEHYLFFKKLKESNCVPEYKLFYNSTIQYLVYEYYKLDFQKLSYNKDI